MFSRRNFLRAIFATPILGALGKKDVVSATVKTTASKTYTSNISNVYVSYKPMGICGIISSYSSGIHPHTNEKYIRRVTMQR